MTAPSAVPDSVFCDDHASYCRCRQPAGHTPPHVCPCGGSWTYDAAGRFQAGELPPPEIRDDLRFDLEW